MSNFAWCNPLNGQREQDDSLAQAVQRIQAELAQQTPGGEFHTITLYEQKPRLYVEKKHAYTFPERSRLLRLCDWFRITFSRKDNTPKEWKEL